jgi:hypothetical protein
MIRALDISLDKRSVEDGLLPLFSLVEGSDGTSKNKPKLLADGCVFPDGQVAVAWYGDTCSLVTWKSLDDFIKVQNAIGDRDLVRNNGAPDGVFSQCFRLRRDTDVTGVSGTGIVAIGCVLISSAVLQWQSETPSIDWYPSFADAEKVHGHNGATVLEDYSFIHSPGWGKSVA